MTEEPGAADARRIVADLVGAGFITDPGARDAELHALRIASPDGVPTGWFVALVSGERLLGFVQLDEDLRFRRFSSFAGHEPAAGDWLESAVALSRARERAGPGLELGRPFLSYDVNPDRLAWVVPATGPDGTERRLFVAGDDVFERRA